MTSSADERVGIRSADYDHVTRSADEHMAISADYDHVTICAPEDMIIRFIDSQAWLKR